MIDITRTEFFSYLRDLTLIRYTHPLVDRGIAWAAKIVQYGRETTKHISATRAHRRAPRWSLESQGHELLRRTLESIRRCK
jgi:hypothetical protein